MMKNTWVLSIKTSLPEVCYHAGDLKTSVFTFDDFDTARTALRKIVKKYAFSENSMFDGNGNISYLKKYSEDGIEDDEDCVDDLLTQSRLTYIGESIKRMLGGDDFVPELGEACDDSMIACIYKNGELHMYGIDDGPYNGYDPTIMTNMFSMSEAKNYYLYIEDMFGQNEASSELYIDLVQAEQFTE